jgi:hypothetical protein
MAALLLANSAFSQDLLVKRNGEQMRVKVLKITKKNVEYVRHGTELPVYKLPVAEVSYIEYPMGDRDIFDKSLAEAKPQVTRGASTPPASTTEGAKPSEKWHGPVPPPQGGQIEVEVSTPEVHRYAVGEIYKKDGIIGIVTVLYDGGLHGLVMSLEEACLAWSTLPRKQTKNTGANNRQDGQANMKAIEKYIAENGLSWDDFPAFKWCRDRGEGWFLPSIEELWSAGTMYMGGTRIASNRKMRRYFNDNMALAGGAPINGLMFYHSSTEDKDTRFSLYSHMNSEPPYIDSGYKADKLFVRAFYKF